MYCTWSVEVLKIIDITSIGKAIHAQAWTGPEFQAPTYLDNRHMKLVRLSVLRSGRIYPPAAHIWQRMCRLRAIVQQNGLCEWLHLEWNPRPYSFQRGASTKFPTACRQLNAVHKEFNIFFFFYLALAYIIFLQAFRTRVFVINFVTTINLFLSLSNWTADVENFVIWQVPNHLRKFVERSLTKIRSKYKILTGERVL